MRRRSDSDLARDLWPYLLQRLRRTAVSATSSGGIFAGELTTHTLSGPYHSGALSNSQGPQFLLRDGTRSLTGNLSVASGITIDGVDLSVHAATASAHHDPVTAGNGILIGGGGQQVGVKLATLSGLEFDVNGAMAVSPGAGIDLDIYTGRVSVRLHPDSGLQLVTGDYLLMGEPLTVGASTTNSISGQSHVHAVESTYDAHLPENAEKLLRTDEDNILNVHTLGAEYLTSVSTTPHLTISPSGQLVIQPALDLVTYDDEVESKSDYFVDDALAIDGWRLWHPAYRKAQLTIGGIKADELYVRQFIADMVRVDLGEEVWSKSRGIVAEAFETPALAASVDVWFENVAGMPSAQIFSAGDWLQFRTIDMAAGLVVQVVWYQVDSFLGDHATEEWQQWRIVRRSGGTTDYEIGKGAVCVDWGASGQGYMYLSALKQDGGPFIQSAYWSGANPYTGGNRKLTTRMGHLSGTFDYTTDDYGFIAGKDIAAALEKDFQGVAIDQTDGVRIMNAALRMYSAAGVKTVDIQPTGNVQFGSNVGATSTRGFEFIAAGTDAGDVIIGNRSANHIKWDQSAGNLNVKGTVTITGGSGYANLTDKPTLGALAAKDSVDLAKSTDVKNRTLDHIADTANFKKPTPTQISGLDANGRLTSAVLPTANVSPPAGSGLLLSSQGMGYYTGGAWKTYIKSDGQFFFAGTATNGLLWNGTRLGGTSGGTWQWYAQASDGKLLAGGGAVTLDADGLAIATSPDGGFVVKNSIRFVYGGDVEATIYNLSASPYDSMLNIVSGGGLTNGGISLRTLLADGSLLSRLHFDPNVSAIYATCNLFSASNNVTVGGTLGVSGSVGIGTTSPASLLEVYGSNATVKVGQHNNAGTVGYEFKHTSIVKNAIVSVARGSWGRGQLYFIQDIAADNDSYELSDAVMAFVNGNVGIGTASPASKLDVNGDIGTGWTTPTLGTGWEAHSSTFHAPGYKRFGDMVILRGVAKRSTGSSGNGTTLFTLASGYRPSKDISLTISAEYSGGNGVALLLVETGGAVKFYGGQSGVRTDAVRLDGVAFSIA
jgi:hypothetical protein